MDDMELIKGLSGCKLSLIDIENTHVVCKSTNDIQYVDRLERQCSKQKNYRCLVTNNENIIVPHVIYESKTKNMFYFHMEYYLAHNSLTFLEVSNILDIDKFIERIIQIIDINIQNSSYKKIKKIVLLKKINDIKEVLERKGTIDIYANFFDKSIKDVQALEDNIEIPVGVCHGDLTLSNILIQDGNFILIDFLDSFIETPLMDIVKIRQDTAHLWSIDVIEKKIDKAKLKLIMAYIDEKIERYYQGRDFMKYYNIFQVINFLRIIPYTQDKILLKNIETSLESIHEMENNHNG